MSPPAGLARLALLCAVLALAACAGKSSRPDHPNKPIKRTPPPSELYAPDRLDGGPPEPPDLSRMAEPIPVPEPRSRYGNRTPYTVLGRTYKVRESASGYVERGKASWYGNKFHGRPTSSFEPYDMYKFTAAHKTLPLPSFVRVTNLANQRSVVVRVNDRGPFHGDRIIDLSYAAAVRLGMHKQGVAEVEVRAIDPEGEAVAADQPAVRTYRSGISAPQSGSMAPRPSAPSTFSGKRYLQVGSFAVKDNAKRLEDQLEGAGLDHVHLETAKVGDNKVWRVRIGPLDARDLDQAQKKLDRLGLRGARVVND